MPEIAGERRSGEFGDRARQFDSSRATTDHHEGQHPADLLLVGMALRPLEGAEQALPDQQGVGEGFQHRRIRRPMVIAEEAVRGARREHEVVERNVGRVHDFYRATFGVDAGHLTHDDGYVPLTA